MKVPSIWFPHSSIWPRWLRYIEFKIRTKVFKQPSYLIDLWTIGHTEFVCEHDLDLEKDGNKYFHQQ